MKLKQTSVVLVVGLVFGFITAKVTGDYIYTKTKQIDSSAECRTQYVCTEYEQGSKGFPVASGIHRICITDKPCEKVVTSGSIYGLPVTVLNTLIWSLLFITSNVAVVAAISRIKYAHTRH